MTGAHWGILAAFAGFAVLVLLLTRRWPRLRASDAADWQDESGDPTHEQIDQARDIVTEPDRQGDQHA